MAENSSHHRARVVISIEEGDDENDSLSHPAEASTLRIGTVITTAQAHGDLRPHEVDPPEGSGRANLPPRGERFWYHPLDLVDRQARVVRKNLMGVEVGYLEHAGNGPASEGSLRIVLFPAPTGSSMHLKIAYNGDEPRQTNAWGYNAQYFSVHPQNHARHRILTARDDIDTGEGNAFYNGNQPSAMAFLHKQWYQMWVDGGWNAVKLGAQRVCMARANGRWVRQSSHLMVSNCVYSLDQLMAGWREI